MTRFTPAAGELTFTVTDTSASFISIPLTEPTSETLSGDKEEKSVGHASVESARLNKKTSTFRELPIGTSRLTVEPDGLKPENTPTAGEQLFATCGIEGPVTFTAKHATEKSNANAETLCENGLCEEADGRTIFKDEVEPCLGEQEANKIAAKAAVLNFRKRTTHTITKCIGLI